MLTQNTSDTENKKQELSNDLIKAEEEYQNVYKELREVEQQMIIARENKARSGATLEGLENRRKDLINTLKNDYFKLNKYGFENLDIKQND